MTNDKTTTVSVRISERKKEKLNSICGNSNISRQEILEGFIDRVISNREKIIENVEPVGDQVLNIVEDDSE